MTENLGEMVALRPRRYNKKDRKEYALTWCKHYRCVTKTLDEYAIGIIKGKFGEGAEITEPLVRCILDALGISLKMEPINETDILNAWKEL